MLKYGSRTQMQHQNVTIEREELNGTHEFVLRIERRAVRVPRVHSSGCGVLCIEHVEVAPHLRGTGHGRQLVQRAVAFAQGHELASGSNLLVRSSCDANAIRRSLLR
jgi:predicted GNAT family acetyltransferase